RAHVRASARPGVADRGHPGDADSHARSGRDVANEDRAIPSRFRQRFRPPRSARRSSSRRRRSPMSRLRLRADRVKWLEGDGEVVALDEQTFVYLNANATASVLWTSLAAGATREELVERLVDGFDVDRATAETDVDAFVSDLEARGLLES